MKYYRITKCRICNSKNLNTLIDFGDISASSFFPKKSNIYSKVTPMIFGICDNCNLAQLLHNYRLKDLYNENYGYRSGINKSMINHLKDITFEIKKIVKLNKNDHVLDIASNDGTLLHSYKTKNIRLVGIDPTIKKLGKFYSKKIKKKAELFNKKTFFKLSRNKKAKVVTSIAMFYDLQDPNKFVSDIKDILTSDGIWVMEMYDVPTLIKSNAYDSICHEHITYMTLSHIEYLCKKNDLRIFKISVNKMNCGSIRYFICHKDAYYKTSNISKYRKLEKIMNKKSTFLKFKKRIKKLSVALKKKINALNRKNKIIHAYGASTKGNILLQYSKITKNDIGFAADRNETKWDRKMPGTNIPIISESKSRNMKPDYYLVLPWHFKKEFIIREKQFAKKGGKFIFPLHNIKII